jgi:EpsI family protein
MIDRRGLILGGSCAVAAAVSEGLKPHREAALLEGAQLADIVPRGFGDWSSEDVRDALALNQNGTLSARLYSDLVVRAYTKAGGPVVTMLLAYGRRQTETLQLHRPEICYPAFGYALARSEPIELPIGPGVQLPARRILAELADRRESVIYWSRVGEFFPQDPQQQRTARFRNTLQGVIADGVLSRFSIAGPYPEYGWMVLDDFIRQLIGAIPADRRKALVGTLRARQLIGARA